MGKPALRDDGLIDASAEVEEWMPDADVVADNDAEPPSSNVRLSEAPVDLSFKVYTLAELDRRSDAPPSMRLSRVAYESLPRRRYEKWRRAATALRTLAAATVRWAKTKNELGLRPSVKTLWPELDAFGNEAQIAVDSVSWKKHGVTVGTVIGAFFTVLFAVLTCAELTDDLKPAGGGHLASPASLEVLPAHAAHRNGASATNWAAMGLQPIDPAAALAPAPIEEVDEPEPPAPPPKPAVVRRKAKGKLTFRNADAIFNP